MVNWQLTATTIHCNTLNEEVTVIVNKDWSAKCTGYEKYSGTGMTATRKVACGGTDCSRVTDYINRLKAEENAE